MEMVIRRRFLGGVQLVLSLSTFYTLYILYVVFIFCMFV